MTQETLPCFSPTAQSINLGDLYEHYKGLRYRILAVARHHETLEELVVYQATYGDNDVWVRPLTMFLEEVIIQGQSTPRFKLINDKR